MRKFRQTAKRTKKNRRLSRRKLTKSKSKSKTRKYKGGSMNDDDYAFVGFYGTGRPIPMLLHINMTFDDKHITRLLGKEREPGIHIDSGNFLILSKLYKLKNMRNLDYIKLISHNTVFINEKNVDTNGFIFTFDWELFARQHIPILNGGQFNEQWLNENNGKRRDAIRQIELQYPGLFKRMFVTEEEQQQALQEIQEKEEAKRIEDLDEFEEIQKRALDEIKQSILKELRTDKPINLSRELSPEKNKVYAEEFENTMAMIPYLQEEQRKKKEYKLKRQFVDDLA